MSMTIPIVKVRLKYSIETIEVIFNPSNTFDTIIGVNITKKIISIADMIIPIAEMQVILVFFKILFLIANIAIIAPGIEKENAIIAPQNLTIFGK